MEPGRAGPPQPRAGLSKKKQLQAENLEVCGRIGAEFGLGPVESAWYTTVNPTNFFLLGCLMRIVSWAFGLPVVPIVDASSAAPVAKVIVTALFGGAFVLGWPVEAWGRQYDAAGDRNALYSGGVARLDRGEPEPRVLRWADVETVTISLYEDDDTPRRSLSTCTLRGRDGTEVNGAGHEAIVLAAYRALAPRLVPPLTEDYDSGTPVATGDACVDREGFTVDPRTRLAWSEIKSVTMKHECKQLAEVVTRIDIHTTRRKKPDSFRPGTTHPNAIFFTHVVARAAADHGIPVVDSHKA